MRARGTMKKAMDSAVDRLALRSHFESGFKPASEFGIGLEYERFGIIGRASAAAGRSTAGGPRYGAESPSPGTSADPAGTTANAGESLPFDGPASVHAIFEGLKSRFGWAPVEGQTPPIEMSRGAARITLEPGLQMELSGSLNRGLDPAADELRQYLDEVRTVSEPLGVVWAAAGTHPTAPIERIPWLPKQRYAIMREYLPTRGRLAHNMMKGTCGAQVNLDFADEADAMEKLRVAMGLTSIVTAAFANSPITAGRRNGRMTERAAIWLETDPDRCGLLRFAFEAGASYDDYVAFALDVPLFFLVRNGSLIPVRGVTFRQFLDHGHEGEQATLEDWHTHLTTLFPEIRLKNYLEVRGTDSNAPSLVLAHAALWKGILYGGRDTLRAAWDLVAKLTWDERVKLLRDVPTQALTASAGGRPVLEIARDVIAIATSGLAAAGASHEDRYLDPLRELVVARGICPAQELLELLGPSAAIDTGTLLDYLTRPLPN